MFDVWKWLNLKLDHSDYDAFLNWISIKNCPVKSCKLGEIKKLKGNFSNTNKAKFEKSPIPMESCPE